MYLAGAGTFSQPRIFVFIGHWEIALRIDGKSVIPIFLHSWILRRPGGAGCGVRKKVFPERDPYNGTAESDTTFWRHNIRVRMRGF